MFRHISDVLPKMLQEELLRLATLDRQWFTWSYLDNPLPDHPEQRAYSGRANQPTWVSKIWRRGSDGFSMHAFSIWLVDGPKIFRPTKEQCTALEQVSVNLHLGDYRQPYPAILIDLPDSSYEPFHAVLCHHSRSDNGDMITVILLSRDHENDITTTVADYQNEHIEQSLVRFDADCSELATTASQALRVATNCCLAMTNFGTVKDYLYPKEVQNDLRLAKEDSERGVKAGIRAALQPQLVRFEKEVVLCHHEGGHLPTGAEETGREISCHWRRGHWHTVLCGKGKANRKLVYYAPVLVRADKLSEGQEKVVTTYVS